MAIQLRVLPPIPIPVLGRNLPDHFARIPRGEDTGRDVVDYHRAAGNDTAAADGHARHHGNHTSNPDIVTDGDGQGILQLLLPLFGME